MQNLIRDIEARIKENSERSEFNEKQERWSEADFYAGKASAEEIADVEIMLEQIKYLWDFEATVNQVKAFKIQRQLGRIADGDKPVLSNKTDAVESPSHYKLDGLNLESIDVIKAVLGADGFKKFCRGNALKYLIRADKKNGTEDLKKARIYLNWEVGDDN